MKKRILCAVFCLCLASLTATAYAHDDCTTIQGYIGFMQELSSGLKNKMDYGDGAAIGNKLNSMISFLRIVNQRAEGTPLSDSLERLENVWMNQSFDSTNKDELAQALGQSAQDLQNLYTKRCGK